MRIRILPFGAAYIALSAVIAAAAANTGNNALYMIAALMLGLFVLSGILSVRSLRLLRTGKVSSGEPHARTRSTVFVEIRNLAWWPQAGVTVDGHPCPSIPARATRLVGLEMVFPRRGQHAMPSVRLESRFPFGFLGRWKASLGEGEVMVYPALGPIDAPPRSSRREPGQGERSSRTGEVMDHRGLRLFRDGDDLRHVHWKKSAQRGDLVAVEYDHRSSGSFELFLDTRERNLERFERAVESVAGQCDRLLRQGAAVALATPRIRFGAHAGEGHRRRLLGFLALVERDV